MPRGQTKEFIEYYTNPELRKKFATPESRVKGGINSGKARREKRKFREYVEGELAKKMKDSELSYKEYIAGKAVKNLLSLNDEKFYKALETVLKITGEFVEKTENKTELTGELKGLDINIINKNNK